MVFTFQRSMDGRPADSPPGVQEGMSASTEEVPVEVWREVLHDGPAGVEKVERDDGVHRVSGAKTGAPSGAMETKRPLSVDEQKGVVCGPLFIFTRGGF